MIDYKEQIKNPLWQKKRLEILSRDKFACVVCGSTDKQLHVHHKKYIAGRDYWDYPDELLVTLCEDCHRKLHGKEELEKTSNPPRPVLHKPKPRLSQMKIVFYKELLDKRNYPDMNYNERIVYSFLVSKSVVCDGQYLDKESGCLNKDWLNADIEESGFIPMANYSYRKIATLLHLTLQAIFNIIHSLKDKGYIGTTEIRLNKCW